MEWTWRVTGIEADPQSGSGSCANFTVRSGGLGSVTFSLRATSGACEPCEKTLSISTGIQAGDIRLTVDRTWLGIDLTSEGRIDTLRATASSSSGGAYQWKLTGAARAGFIPDPPGSANQVTVREVGIPSASTSGEVVRVISGSCQAERNFTVVKLDIQSRVLEAEEEEPGLLIGVNDNDSDKSEKPDFSESPLAEDDPDLIPLTISIAPGDLPDDHKIELTGIEHCYEDRRKMTRAAAQYPMSRIRQGLILYVEGTTPGTYTISARHPPSGARDQVKVAVLKIGLVPNYDRDDDIDSDDVARAAAGETIHFWINNDDDSGADGGNDIPGDGSADSANGSVDGVRDLVDFFPVWVDIKDTLSVLPMADYDYVLKHASGALNAFACNSLPISSNPDLKPNAHLYSTSFGATYGTYSVGQVTASGLTLPEGFLNEILNNDRGIVLLEGRSTTTAPLVLEVRRKSDSATICEKEMPLSLSGAEDMYRHINLRPSGGLPTSTGEPSNYPDSLCNSKNVFFLHGFSVSGNGARGWHTEMFKRLYWSGSNAKFWGVTWEGDLGLISALHYQEDVANAFLVASDLYDEINSVPNKVMLAHSLGNMVVSAAIQDHGLSVSKYFMLNAAVATESYRPASFNDATMGNHMLHEDWVGYNSNTWCSTWFDLFTSPDDRRELTWKNRFPATVSVACNFYSSGDEIFEVYTTGTPSAFSGGLWHLERYAWQKQEMFKGRTVLGVPVLGGTDWAGWGFSGEYTISEANAATPDNLRTNAVFRQEPSSMFSSNITAQTVNDIIAQGVPALSYAAGLNAVNLLNFFNYNAENNKPNGWGRNDPTYGTRWKHSDLKNMAYLYTYDFFKQVVSQGDLE
ncbi:MAG: hypothetical protein H3C50_03460 [Kiritimatiellae bacterium]|nr:hypothetical protein [Kiritimatiellia bacterium]